MDAVTIGEPLEVPGVPDRALMPLLDPLLAAKIAAALPGYCENIVNENGDTVIALRVQPPEAEPKPHPASAAADPEKEPGGGKEPSSGAGSKPEPEPKDKDDEEESDASAFEKACAVYCDCRRCLTVARSTA